MTSFISTTPLPHRSKTFLSSTKPVITNCRHIANCSAFSRTAKRRSTPKPPICSSARQITSPFVLFQGDGYAEIAADHAMEIKTPIKLAKKFGSSIYASCREFARTHARACVVYILEPITYAEGTGASAQVRRIEASPLFLQQFGRPTEQVITLDHSLGRVLPIGRKMTRATTVSITDPKRTSARMPRRGVRHNIQCSCSGLSSEGPHVERAHHLAAASDTYRIFPRLRA